MGFHFYDIMIIIIIFILKTTPCLYQIFLHFRDSTVFENPLLKTNAPIVGFCCSVIFTSPHSVFVSTGVTADRDFRFGSRVVAAALKAQRSLEEGSAFEDALKKDPAPLSPAPSNGGEMESEHSRCHY